MALHDLSFISVKNQSQGFPQHFHETFCISLISEGVEKIELQDKVLYTEADAISITNPYELHSNPLIDGGIKVSFDTIYISNDLMAHCLGGKNIIFNNRQIQTPDTVKSFKTLLQQLRFKKSSDYNDLLKAFTNNISRHSDIVSGNQPDFFNTKHLNDIVSYIDHNLENKIRLDELAKVANVNKYGFAKTFKASTGMSPMNYVLMKKIFSAKSKIEAICDITELAYAYNFSDVAHFSNTFKRYVGISPKEYQKSL